MLRSSASKLEAVVADATMLFTRNMRELMVSADSELSAIAHGRPASEKDELLRIALGLRAIYEKSRAVEASNAAG